MDMIGIAFAQGAYKLTLALTAVILLSYTLKWLNSVTGNKFDDTLTNATPDTRLVYFGARLVGYAYIVGSVLS